MDRYRLKSKLLRKAEEKNYTAVKRYLKLYQLDTDIVNDLIRIIISNDNKKMFNVFMKEEKVKNKLSYDVIFYPTIEKTGFLRKDKRFSEKKKFNEELRNREYSYLIISNVGFNTLKENFHYKDPEYLDLINKHHVSFIMLDRMVKTRKIKDKILSMG